MRTKLLCMMAFMLLVLYAPLAAGAVDDPVDGSISTADFNRDGKLDLIVTNGVRNSISFLPGDGLGKFGKPTEIAVGSRPVFATCADFNGDGKQDLAVANNGSRNVSVLLGNGDGTFEKQFDLPAGWEPEFITARDFNRDGKQDLAVANYGAWASSTNIGSITILLGLGNGRFRRGVSFRSGSNPSSVAVGDFNTDGKPDVVVTVAGANLVWVRLGDGKGRFRRTPFYDVGGSPDSVAVSDFNSDGKQDIAVANGGSSTISILFGNGMGTFTRSDQMLKVDTAPRTPVVGDFNRDGIPDLATANGNGRTISVLLGRQTGIFYDPVSKAVGTYPTAIVVGDFNRDGKDDLATSNDIVRTVSIFLGDGTGGFGNPISYKTVLDGMSAVWFDPINDPNKPDWEILPQEAKAGEVILSKRNELGILSNFAATPFELYGKRYASVEGFWQMMLYPEGPDDERAKDKRVTWQYTRASVAQMTAFEAKSAGTLAEENMKTLGIDWCSFGGKRFPYRSATPGEHYKLILAAMRAKANQNPEVKRILLATGNLTLKPDHHGEPNPPPEWKYYDIWMQIRSELQKPAR